MDKNDIIEYVMNTPHNTNPAILGQMIDEIGSGSGDSWTTLTEENITASEGPLGDYISATLQYDSLISQDKITVTWDGVEYICTNESTEDGNQYGAPLIDDSFDWSEYPFTLMSFERPAAVGGGVMNLIYTQFAGTYTIKIEAPQSGSSDFSTAQVTVVNNTDSDVSTYGPVANIGDFGEMNISPQFTFSRGESLTILVMHKQHTYISLNTSATITVEGSAEIDGPDVIITGDCTITIGQAKSASA